MYAASLVNDKQHHFNGATAGFVGLGESLASFNAWVSDRRSFGVKGILWRSMIYPVCQAHFIPQ
jgi:hypothetical protein